VVRGTLSLDRSDLAQLGGTSVVSGDPRRGYSLDPAQLSDKQVDLLVRQMRGEDPKAAREARARLMARLEPLIGAALNRVGLKGEDRDDARTAAQEAALRTLGRYEPDSGAKLTTFVFPRIRGAVLNYIERERSLRTGSLDAEREHRTVVSFDQGFDEGDDWVPLEERIADEHAADPQQEATSKDASDRLARLFGALPERDRNVLRWRFGFDGEALSYDEIGKRLGVSGEMARRIEAQAIETARRRPSASLLGDETLAHRTPPAGVEELARAARRIQRASVNGQKVSLKTAIGIAITRERELHPNHVEHLERESPRGLALRIDEALHRRPSKPVPPPPPPPVSAAMQTKETALAWS
jgi:RNA polymerase sigma factor (sigma-70 family)